jgi:hypothetical protein
MNDKRRGKNIGKPKTLSNATNASRFAGLFTVHVLAYVTTLWVLF